MKIVYLVRRFHKKTLALIAQADTICQRYALQGFVLTVRQIFYRLVAGGVLENNAESYDNLQDHLKNGRLAGLIDWLHIEDRTRHFRALPHNRSFQEIIEAQAQTITDDLWRDQDVWVAVAIEKDALLGVIEGVCHANDVGFFSCRGFDSVSDVWRAAVRLLEAFWAGKTRLVVLHLSDHDASGLDMHRDLTKRLTLFLRRHDPAAAEALEVKRIGLTREQVREHTLPPNRLDKVKDPRWPAYLAEHGPETWELDALEPDAIAGLIQEAVDDLRDADRWKAAIKARDAYRAMLGRIAARWDEIEAVYGQDGVDGDTGAAPEGTSWVD